MPVCLSSSSLARHLVCRKCSVRVDESRSAWLSECAKGSSGGPPLPWNLTFHQGVLSPSTSVRDLGILFPGPNPNRYPCFLSAQLRQAGVSEGLARGGAAGKEQRGTSTHTRADSDSRGSGFSPARASSAQGATPHRVHAGGRGGFT